MRSILRDIKLKNLSSSDLTITTLIYSYLFFLLRRHRVSERTKKTIISQAIYIFIHLWHSTSKSLYSDHFTFFYICSVIKCGRYKNEFCFVNQLIIIDCVFLPLHSPLVVCLFYYRATFFVYFHDGTDRQLKLVLGSSNLLIQ